MNTYVPVRKIVKVVSTHRNAKRERCSSLQESREPRRRRSRWNSWTILLLMSFLFVYLYFRRNQSVPETKEFFIVRKVNVVEDSPTRKQPWPRSFETTETQATTKKDALDAAIDAQAKAEKLPHCLLKKPYAKTSLNITSVNITANKVYPWLKKGGYYRPPDCKAKHKVGIIVPYRYREHNLGIFLYNMHPFLMQQKLEYQIFVIEQTGNELFNKGRLINAGFREMMKFNTFQCVVIHDLDLLPTDENILYTCPTLPRHMCATVNDSDARRATNETYLYKSIFGGVVSMTVEQFERANGYSNLYFGWGGEDNDMYWRHNRTYLRKDYVRLEGDVWKEKREAFALQWDNKGEIDTLIDRTLKSQRLRGAGYPLVRYNKSIGVYIVLPHTREEANPYRNHLLSRSVERFKTDGLSDLEYYVMSTKFRHLCTHIVVDINPRGDNITELYTKWANRTFYKYK